jgi:hypothetical protein
MKHEAEEKKKNPHYDEDIENACVNAFTWAKAINAQARAVSQ